MPNTFLTFSPSMTVRLTIQKIALPFGETHGFADMNMPYNEIENTITSINPNILFVFFRGDIGWDIEFMENLKDTICKEIPIVLLSDTKNWPCDYHSTMPFRQQFITDVIEWITRQKAITENFESLNSKIINTNVNKISNKTKI
jgi:hypothetical protein